MTFTSERYTALQDIFRNTCLPLPLVDLDAFASSVPYAAEKAQIMGKTIRQGSQSIRCEPEIKPIMDHSDIQQGYQPYTTIETRSSANKGHDDFICLYASIQPADRDNFIRPTLEGEAVNGRGDRESSWIVSR